MPADMPIRTELLPGNLFKFVRPIEAQIGPWPPIVVPAGYITDFASVPSTLHWWIRPTDKRAARGGAVHDWIYHTHILPRCVADAVLQVMLREDGMSRIEANAFTCAVHICGQRSYMRGPSILRSRTPELATYIKETPEIERKAQK